MGQPSNKKEAASEKGSLSICGQAADLVENILDTQLDAIYIAKIRGLEIRFADKIRPAVSEAIVGFACLIGSSSAGSREDNRTRIWLAAKEIPVPQFLFNRFPKLRTVPLS